MSARDTPDDDEILADRREDLYLIRLCEEAVRRGRKTQAKALRILARQAEFRARGALGIFITRRAGP